MSTTSWLLPLLLLTTPLLVWTLEGLQGPQATSTERPAPVHYLEVVTPEVEATCAALARLHGVRFGEPVAALGQARTAPLAGGGRIGVRAPLSESEEPVVRPYVLVPDIEAALVAAQAAGAEIALGATELAGQGQCAIYFLGGIQHGLWQL